MPARTPETNDKTIKVNSEIENTKLLSSHPFQRWTRERIASILQNPMITVLDD